MPNPSCVTSTNNNKNNYSKPRIFVDNIQDVRIIMLPSLELNEPNKKIVTVSPENTRFCYSYTCFDTNPETKTFTLS